MAGSRRGNRPSKRRGGGRGGSKQRNDGCYICGGDHYARDCPRNGGNGTSQKTPTKKDPERRFFDKMTKDEDGSIESPKEGTRLLKAALTYATVEGGPALLYRLDDPHLFGSGALRKSLEFMTDKTLFVEGFLPLLEFLGREELHKPVYAAPLKSILLKLYGMPFLVTFIEQHCKDGHVTTNTERTALVWFFTMLALEDSGARKDEKIKRMVKEQFEQYGGTESLQTVLNGGSLLSNIPTVSLSDVRSSQAQLPGGRHDNDESDFRSIKIVPTLDEFNCDADPYLPKVDADVPTAIAMTEAEILDRQFRLLREDIIGPSKEQQDDPRKEQRDIFYGLRVDHVETGAPVKEERGKKEVQLIGPTAPCISFRFQVPRWSKLHKLHEFHKREEYWEKNRRLLPRNALVCLQRRNSQEEWTPIRFATIGRRETKELARKVPLIGLAFLTEKDTMETLQELSDPSIPPTRLCIISGELFAYEPILRGLQLMSEIPFADEIVRGIQVEMEVKDQIDLHTGMDDEVGKKVGLLDSGQTTALHRALKHRVTLIQGPPGTGKTFIGVLLAQILLSKSTDTILVVTYTNHALDDFLEDLLDVGIKEIVRLGGRSRSDRLAQYNLRELASSGKAPFTREQNRRYAQLKQTIEEAEKEVKRLKRVLSKEIGEKWWKTVSVFLKNNYEDCWSQLYLSDSDLRDSDGFQVQGISGVDHLWKYWLKGKDPPEFLRGRVGGELWRLTKDRRREQKLVWQHEMYEFERSEMATALKTIKTAKAELKLLSEVTDAAILSRVRVIGCTTTKAAMCKHLLDAVSAEIVLVEEAAEILEAHVLTSLSPGSKRLIMIGDHKQLRPKCQYYPLTVESGRGFDLNKSLFERLASILPVSTLEVQHRMHPEISSIPKLVTYDGLRDAEAVSNHPMPEGISSRIVFIDHDVQEDRESAASDTIDTVSRTNMHEVKMAVAIVRYLLQQNYKPSDLVVLTPYLGQMMKIQDALARYFDVLVDDRDLDDARRQLTGAEAAVNTQKKNPPKQSPVRVATIDNYQGEEAKVVISSLVRSNPKGEIGFLKEPERVNVMMSRARNCEIIIGNKSTFENARGTHEPLRGGPLWKKIICSLESSGCVFPGLPVRCQRHGRKEMVVNPTDFQSVCPDGGCNEKCGRELDCGHFCTKRCHIGPCSPCIVLCPDTCPRGHPMMRACSRDPPACTRIVTWRCPMNHHISGPCLANFFSVPCKSCLKLKKEAEERSNREQELQAQLDKKYEELEGLNRKAEDARQAKLHRDKLQTIDAELDLARKALSEAMEVDPPVVTSVESPYSDEVENAYDARAEELPPFESKVRKILEAQPGPLDPNILLQRYKAEYRSDLKSDAQKALKRSPSEIEKSSKKQKKLKDVLTEISCCEVLMHSTSKSDKRTTKMLVRLREHPPSTSYPASREPSMSSDDQEAVSDPEPTRIKQRTEVAAEVPLMSQIDSKAMPEDQARTQPERDDEQMAAKVAPSSEKQTDNRKANGSTRVLRDDKKIAEDDDSSYIFVLQRRVSDDVLSAHNLLEQTIGADVDGISDGMKALSVIIGDELDPYGASRDPPSMRLTHSKLTQALCSLAHAISLSNEFPLQARNFALLFVKHSQTLGEEFPQEWIKRAKQLSELPDPRNIAGKSTVSKTSLSDQWKAIEDQDRNAPAIMRDSILPMIGLDDVKEEFISLYHRICLSKEQNDATAPDYNVRFEGNPGTGKTTIARHYGTFLCQLGALPEDSISKETSGSKLIFDGVKGLKDILEEIKKVGGGVVFVDEAYQLVTDREGKKVLDFILPLAENIKTDYGDIVWVFAGYKKEMEKLFEHNVGLPSRFPLRFIFEDYSDKELQLIFQDMMLFQHRSSSQTTDQPKMKTSNSRTSSRRGYSGSTTTGRLGRIWTYGPNGWVDEYGNLTVDPSRVGYVNSELVSPNGIMWTENKGIWNGNNNSSQSHYPGSPEPLKSSKRERRSQPFRCDEKHLRIAIRRLGRSRGENGFGNARAVRSLFKLSLKRQGTRIMEERGRGKSPCIFTLGQTDLLGPNITADSLKRSAAWLKLEKMEGLLPVKESVHQLFDLVLKNVERERSEKPLFQVVLNRLFLGNPGTGKTTVAKLYGEILKDLGLLSKGELVMKVASDFIGSALGESEKTTQSILMAAQGCVLVIDEAYSLYSGGSGTAGSNNDPYKTAVIDTIVEKVQAKPGADIAVILIGYQEQMEEMMRKVNPGLSRRFQIEHAFSFPDFDNAALCRIMMQSAREQSVKLQLSVAKRAVLTLAKARAKPHFGNAGSVDNSLSRAIAAMQTRKGSTELLPEDFGYSGDGPDSDALSSLFDGLIGCKEVKDTMEELRNTVEFSVANGMPATQKVNYNYLFLGNPGTGKTTLARKMGKMFYALGLLASDDLKEAKASDLLTGYAGQSGLKTREILQESRGGVLFIDEAYQLNPAHGGAYMTEAVNELVGCLTENLFKGKLLVILAGYDADMNEMLKTNPGLQSRFSERVHFHDFDANATVELLEMELQKNNIPLGHGEDLLSLQSLAQKLVDSENFANGRDVDTWAKRVFKVVAKKYAGSSDQGRGATSTVRDAEEALDYILKSRNARNTGQKCAMVARPQNEVGATQDARMAPPPPAAQTKMICSQNDHKDEEEDETQPAESAQMVPDNAFEGIDKEVLTTLQDFMDEQGLSSKDGARQLAGMGPDSPMFNDLVARLQRELKLGPADAKAKLEEWQSLQQDLEKLLEEEAKKTKTMGARPIWRCGVCGRADKPWIACYVAPFIVRYEVVPVGDS